MTPCCQNNGGGSFRFSHPGYLCRVTPPAAPAAPSGAVRSSSTDLGARVPPAAFSVAGRGGAGTWCLSQPEWGVPWGPSLRLRSEQNPSQRLLLVSADPQGLGLELLTRPRSHWDPTACSPGTPGSDFLRTMPTAGWPGCVPGLHPVIQGCRVWQWSVLRHHRAPGTRGE